MIKLFRILKMKVLFVLAICSICSCSGKSQEIGDEGDDSLTYLCVIGATSDVQKLQSTIVVQGNLSVVSSSLRCNTLFLELAINDDCVHDVVLEFTFYNAQSITGTTIVKIPDFIGSYNYQIKLSVPDDSVYYQLSKCIEVSYKVPEYKSVPLGDKLVYKANVIKTKSLGKNLISIVCESTDYVYLLVRDRTIVQRVLYSGKAIPTAFSVDTILILEKGE